MTSHGRTIHQEAGEEREKGNFLKALQLTDAALIAYQEDNDRLGFTEVLADRSISLRHLYEQTSAKEYLILAEYETKAAVEIAQESSNAEALALPFFNLAKIQEELGKLPEAIANYKNALEHTSTMKPAALTDITIHLESCIYKSGDKSALERIDRAIEKLSNAEESDYNKLVWLSGAHLRTAHAIYQDDKAAALNHLQEAKKIIDSDDRLTLRANQWQKLAEIIR